MRPDASGAAHTPLPTLLRIHFAKGERPHLFWLSTRCETGAGWIKVLSKRRADGAVEVLVVQEGGREGRKALARVEVPVDAPSGWLANWVRTLGRELDVEFREYDLRRIESVEAWRTTARGLGWLRTAVRGTGAA